ncbi:4af574d7-0771-4a16-96d2-201640d16fec [Sclerotinia trifoliorum]|uniref:4af574d7-0771-4a16-96d2-201640d16fec n=1 Tax=Sclerotinia trifoliorum TaxID=28548 RepID=A0A8H2ZMY0_9HELO|nr:4af574d7-0771-4a16-96d2-201640d16fec [Sclerotinia trifoliorum]
MYIERRDPNGITFNFILMIILSYWNRTIVLWDTKSDLKNNVGLEQDDWLKEYESEDTEIAVEGELDDWRTDHEHTETDVECEVEETLDNSEPPISILERMPYEIRQMVFVCCGRSAFCSAGQGPDLLQALRGQPLSYRHALSIFERLNSYELEARLKNDALGEDHPVDEMIRLMTVNQKEPSPFPHLDLDLTLYGCLPENQEQHGDFWASTPETVMCDFVRELHNASCTRDVSLSYETRLPTKVSSLIITCQNDQGDWTFLKNFLSLVPCRNLTRVIVPLPNPENYLGSSTPTEYSYHGEDTFLNNRAKQDSLALAVIENIDKKLGVQGVILGRSKNNLSGFCMWEAPKGQHMDWSQELIEPWALRGGFGKAFLDQENNSFELNECIHNGTFFMSNSYETESMRCLSKNGGILVIDWFYKIEENVALHGVYEGCVVKRAKIIQCILRVEGPVAQEFVWILVVGTV